jgi:hypothetical protein
MAEIVAFPSSGAPKCGFEEVGVVGVASGVSVRLVERLAWPHDLLVVLGGTAEGSTTVASVPAIDRDVAHVIAQAVLASLSAVSQAGSAAVV